MDSRQPAATAFSVINDRFVCRDPQFAKRNDVMALVGTRATSLLAALRALCVPIEAARVVDTAGFTGDTGGIGKSIGFLICTNDSRKIGSLSYQNRLPCSTLAALHKNLIAELAGRLTYTQLMALPHGQRCLVPQLARDRWAPRAHVCVCSLLEKGVTICPTSTPCSCLTRAWPLC